MKKSAILVLIITLAGIFGCSGNIVHFGPCPTEDSINCYWDAKEHGNGKGTSFVNIDGKIHYFH